MIVDTDRIAALFGSLAMGSFFRACVTALLNTPGRTRDTDKKKQRGKFHVHIIWIPIMRGGITIDWQDKQREHT